MDFSRRIAALPPSPTVSLNAKAKELESAGQKVLNFTVGEPDFDTPDIVVEAAIAAMRKGRTKYGAAGGGLPLRKAIAAKFARENQIEHNPADIVVGMGAKELLFHLSLALLNDGDEVLIPAPYWVSYPAHVMAAGAVPVIIPMHEFEQSGITPQTIAKYATAKTRAIILNSPNNPSGYVMSRENIEELGSYLESKSWWVISDEIYEYLAFDRPHVSLAQTTPKLRDRLILVHGLAKGYAMTGWRVGFALTPPAVTKPLNILQSQSSTCLPGFIEDASVVALNHGRSLLEDKFTDLQRRRDLVVDRVKQLPGVRYIPPEGAFYIFLDIREALASARKLKDNNSLKFGEYLLSQYHVATVPGDAFGAPGYLRISYATAESEIREGLERVGQALQSIQ